MVPVWHAFYLQRAKRRLVFVTMKNISRWGGYFASIFAIIYFISVILFRVQVNTVPSSLLAYTRFCSLVLGAFSGLVCIVSAILSAILPPALRADQKGFANQ